MACFVPASLLFLQGVAACGRGADLAEAVVPTSAQQQQTCTLYVSASGSDKNSGSTPSSAITLLGAARRAVAGNVVCIQPGNYSLASSFYPAHSGNPNAWITFQNTGGGVVHILWTAGSNAPDRNMFHMYNANFPNGPSYIEFKGLTLDGQNVASNGFFCQGSHHLRYLQNTIINQGSAGIGSMRCDYQTADHNILYHNGYHGGWSSAISYNSSQWFDKYQGLHNIVSNNIIAGSYDSSSYHTDGNGIIMDLSSGSYTASTANTPPALIVNNVVYGNGGRCIENNVVTNIWVVNNTCYDNGLDLTLGPVGSITSHSASHEYFVNNVVQSWDNRPPFMVQGSGSTNLIYSHNLIYGGSNSGVSDTNPADFRSTNPLFVNPPAFNPSNGGQYANALNPAYLGSGLTLKSNSPALDTGVDPASLAGSNSALINDMSRYIYSDINGKPRPKGSPFTLGAYIP